MNLEYVPRRLLTQHLNEGWTVVYYRDNDYATLMSAPAGWEALLLDDKKPFRACSVRGCNEIHKARGFCLKHYERFQNYGDPQTVLRRGRVTHIGCNEAGCQNPHRGRGLCHKHLQRLRKAQMRALQCQEAA